MYWFKKRLLYTVAFAGIITAACLAACRPGGRETGAGLKYFDVRGYFLKDAERLKKNNRLVLKTATHNNITETKTVRINDWAKELTLFIASDINKPAWKDSYSIVATDDFLIYKAKTPELKTRELLVKKTNGKIKYVLIFNRTTNILYQTTEKLSYFVDSLYVIEKIQRVRLMGTNNYKISGIMAR